MKKIGFLLLNILFIFNFQSFAQTIKGQVVDSENGQTIPGATVYIKGTNSGTISDLDGNFVLNVPEGLSKLNITSIGYVDYSEDINVVDELDLGSIELVSNAIGLEEIKVFASFAVDRKTPIAVSTIDPVTITEKLGTQEFPEILKTTPSVYVTKQGGGYGDSRINLRGFASSNVAVLINGAPVNDMENGWVYWSNWAGLSDVTRTMQVQRGIGASKLAISSVGGTINILTKTTDMEKGAVISYGVGNNGFSKTAFTLSTGMYENGWAVTASGSHTKGDGFVKGTNFDAWSYYLNISKRFTSKSQISFNVFGAPQWHNQRHNMRSIESYRNDPDGIKMNWDYGYRNGEIYSGGYAYNFYHKPVVSFNHFLKISDKLSLNTVVYASFGRGGGRRIYGENVLGFTYPGGEVMETTYQTPDGYLDFDTVMTMNQASQTGSKSVIAMSMNSHDWYGVLSTLKYDFDNFTFTGGFDGRYYKGYHYRVIDDLLGGDYYLDGTADINRDPSTPLHEGDYVSYYNVGVVLWGGLFGQIEYTTDNFSGFISASGSTTQYQRIDFFTYTPEEGQVSERVPFLSYSVKGGINYNITDAFNIFANGGYFTRPPFHKFAFQGYTNAINKVNGKTISNERILTMETGLGYKSKFVKANLYAYYTHWMDKALTVSMGSARANITGLNALHKGLEFVAQVRPFPKTNIGLMGSMGDWRWENDVVADIYDQDENLVGTTTVYAHGIHVSDAAQTTAAITFDYEILPKLKIGSDWTYYDRLYAKFDITQRGDADEAGVDAWEMPSYNLLDFNLRYDFNIGNSSASLFGKMNNALDVEYLSDALDGTNHDAASSYVFYGYGRNWSLSLKVKF